MLLRASKLMFVVSGGKRYFSILLSKLAWGKSKGIFKTFHKMGSILKTTFIDDFLQRFVGCFQQELSIGKTFLDQPFCRGCFKVYFKISPKGRKATSAKSRIILRG